MLLNGFSCKGKLFCVECCQKLDESNLVTVQCAPCLHHRNEEVTDDVASETYYFLIVVKSV